MAIDPSNANGAADALTPPGPGEYAAPEAAELERLAHEEKLRRQYKVICISLYRTDLDDIDAKVAELKRRGWTKANRSHLIRLALSRLDELALASIADAHRRIR